MTTTKWKKNRTTNARKTKVPRASLDTETIRIDSQSSETGEKKKNSTKILNKIGTQKVTSEWKAERKKINAEPNLTLTNEKRTPNWAQNVTA